MTDLDPYSDEPRSKFTGFIPEKLYHIVEREPLEEDAKVVSELASRFLDLKEIDPRKPIVLLHVFSKLLRTSPSALWTTLEILAGGRGLGRSLSERGDKVSFSKQAIHQRQSRDLEKIEAFLPEIAKAMETILKRRGSEEKKEGKQ